MKRIYWLAALLCMAHVALAQNAKPIYIPGEMYVRFRVVPEDQSSYIPNPNTQPSKASPDIINSYHPIYFKQAFHPGIDELADIYRIKLADDTKVTELIHILKNKKDVEYAERIPYAYSTREAPREDDGKQWYFKTIKMEWRNVPSSGKIINVAVVDNAIRYTHEDLKNMLMINHGEYENPDGVDNDNNKVIDDYYGADLANNDGNTNPPPLPNSPRVPEKYFCHGTHVAGIVAADNNNGIGVASMCGDVRILPVKATPDGSDDDGVLTQYAEGVAYAAHRGVNVINCSWEISADASNISALRDAVNYALKRNIVIVAAAGNGGGDIPVYPAAFDGVIGVGYTDQNDYKVGSSNYGKYVDVMAPGQNIFSTLSYHDQDYGTMSGSSMATPLVSSLVALILSQNDFTPAQVQDIIKGNCDNIDDVNHNYAGKLGAGRINVGKTINAMFTYTSVKEVAGYTDFTVYPNPTAGNVYIPFDRISPEGQPVTLSIFNVTGCEVYSTVMEGDASHINVSELPNGLYYVTTVTTRGERFRTRLVVSH